MCDEGEKDEGGYLFLLSTSIIHSTTCSNDGLHGQQNDNSKNQLLDHESQSNRVGRFTFRVVGSLRKW